MRTGEGSRTTQATVPTTRLATRRSLDSASFQTVPRATTFRSTSSQTPPQIPTRPCRSQDSQNATSNLSFNKFSNSTREGNSTNSSSNLPGLISSWKFSNANISSTSVGDAQVGNSSGTTSLELDIGRAH